MVSKKVLLTFLGNGIYESISYKFPKEEIPSKKLFFSAINEYYQKINDKLDKIVIFGTNGSRWDEIHNYITGGNGSSDAVSNFREVLDRPEEKDHIQYVKELSDALKTKVQIIKITEGSKKELILKNQEILLNYDNYLDTDSEIELVIDITHSFRSIPIYLLNLLIYIQNFEKRITIKSIVYGQKEGGKVVELLPLLNLQNTIQAANDFFKYGKMKSAGDLLLEVDPNPFSKNNSLIRKIKDELKNLDWYISSCSLIEIKKGNYVQNIIEKLCFEDKGNGVKEPVLDGICNSAEQLVIKSILTDLMANFKKDDYKNIESSIRWALKYDMIIQAYTLSREYAIFVVNHRKPIKKEDKSLSDTLSYRILKGDFGKKLQCYYDTIRQIRNDLDHGYIDINCSLEMLKKRLFNFLDDYFNELSKIK